jgi:hypothetical protein
VRWFNTFYEMSAWIEALEGRTFLSSAGLSATYFKNDNFTGKTYTRVERSVNFDWPNHVSPAPGIGGTTFAVRYSGLVKPAASETYSFITRNNDGVRLWVNGRLIINSWMLSARRTLVGKISLKANHVYDLRLEYFDHKRTAAISLSWRSASTAYGVVPASRLTAYDLRAAAIGDFGRADDYERGMAKMVKAWGPQFVLTVGDNNYPDGDASTIDRNVGQFFHSYIAPYNGIYGLGAKSNAFFPALGNHDWHTARASAYFNYFTLPNNERYYDFVRGPVK